MGYSYYEDETKIPCTLGKRINFYFRNENEIFKPAYAPPCVIPKFV